MFLFTILVEAKVIEAVTKYQELYDMKNSNYMKATPTYVRGSIVSYRPRYIIWHALYAPQYTPSLKTFWKFDTFIGPRSEPWQFNLIS